MAKETEVKNPYSVKAVKSFMGREGMGYECSLYKDGKRIGKVVDTCDGGGMVQCYLNKGEEEALETFCKSLPKEQWSEEEFFSKEEFYKYYPEGFEVDVCSFMAKMVDEFEAKAKLKKLCRNKTVFTLKSDKKPNSIWTIKTPYSSQVKKYLQNKHGDDLKEILNEQL